jgi:hypothetical protein
LGSIQDNPFAVLAVSLVAQSLAAFAGDLFSRRRRLKPDEQSDFDVLRTAALTLLALIIGFSFSMAVSRYDQRKNYEAAEANAIGTAFARADLLTNQDSTTIRQLLVRYTDQRILFYETAGQHQINQVDANTAKLQNELWSIVVRAAAAQPMSMTVALAVSSMNDVLNSQGYTQAAWWNRIPVAAWGLMGLIAIACNFLIGLGERQSSAYMLVVLPIVVSISFFLIADIDSPSAGISGGIISVVPQNLVALAQAIRAH